MFNNLKLCPGAETIREISDCRTNHLVSESQNMWFLTDKAYQNEAYNWLTYFYLYFIYMCFFYLHVQNVFKITKSQIVVFILQNALINHTK